MDNIISIIGEIIEVCNKYNDFDASTLFVKTDCPHKYVTLIAIESASEAPDRVDLNDVHYNIIRMDLSSCYSRILSTDMFFAEIFNKSLCLKDELNIAPTILSSIMPILKAKHRRLEVEATSYEKFYKNRIKEISIRFNSVVDTNNFVNRIYVPLSCSMRECLSKAHVFFQHSQHGTMKSISVTFFFEDNPPEDLLINIQKYLYLNSAELNLLNIDIPYDRPNCIIDSMEESFNLEVIKSLDALTSDILIHNREMVLENSMVKVLIYLYLVTGKILFQDYSDFIECNDEIYDCYLNREHSDNLDYIINNHIYMDCFSKKEREFYILTVNNLYALISNYKHLLEDWRAKNYYENEYEQFIAQLFIVKSKLKDSPKMFFQAYVDLLFSCYNISAYYKAYIPYVIKYLNNEI